MRSDTPLCPLHGEHTLVDCWQCGGEGLYGHDCGEDCCVCLRPEENERCYICNGKGGRFVCLGCHPEVAEEVYG